MNEDLKKFIEQHYPGFEKLEPMAKSELFLDIYKDLVELFERDFNYMLQIVERKCHT